MRHGRTHRTAALAAALILLASAGGCDGSSQEDDRSPAKGEDHRSAAKGKARPASPPDFDGDGYEDAAVVVTGSDAADLSWDIGPVVVFRGGPDGLRLTGKPLIAGSGRSVDGFLEEGFSSDLTADLNSDGFSDLILQARVLVPNTQDNQESKDNQEQGSSRTVVFHGGKDGLSTTPVRLHVPRDGPRLRFRPAEAADFDGDGHVDLYGAGRLLMGPFDADGKPKASRRLSDGGSTAADFDQDGRTDLLVHNDYYEDYDGDKPMRPLRYFRGTPGQGLEEDSEVSRRLSEIEMVGYKGSDVHAGTDLDGDGYPDLFLPGSDEYESEYVRGGPDGFRSGTARLTVDNGFSSVDDHVLTGHVTSASDRNTVSTVDYGSADQQGHLQLARLTTKGSAVTMTGLQIVDLDTEGIAGDAFQSDNVKRDSFGEYLRVLDADNDGHDDVLTFAPFSGPDGRYGGIWILPGTPDGLRTRGVHRYTMPDLGL